MAAEAGTSAPVPTFESMDDYVTRLGGKRAFRKVLIANNGIAAVKAIRSVRRWAYETFGDARLVRCGCWRCHMRVVVVHTVAAWRFGVFACAPGLRGAVATWRASWCGAHSPPHPGAWCGESTARIAPLHTAWVFVLALGGQRGCTVLVAVSTGLTTCVMMSLPHTLHQRPVPHHRSSSSS